MDWVHHVLTWLNKPHGIVLVAVMVLGIVTMVALWPMSQRGKR